jgi:hypothetical protein
MKTPNTKVGMSDARRTVTSLWSAMSRRARWLLQPLRRAWGDAEVSAPRRRLPNPTTSFRTRNKRRRITEGERGPALSLPLAVAAWMVPTLVAAAAFTSPLLGARAYEYLLESDHFFVREVIVDGHDRLDPETIRDLAGIDAETNTLAADLDLMGERLLMHPWIASVEVNRELPDRLFIHISEEIPRGCILLDDVYIVNGMGHPFTLADPRDPLDFPVITGLSIAAFNDDAQAHEARARIRAAVNLHRLYDHLQLDGRWPLSEIRLENDRDMSLVLSDVGTEAVLGSDAYREKLYRLEWVMESLHQQGKVADYVLLDAAQEIDGSIDGGRVVVRANLAPSNKEVADRAKLRAKEATRQLEARTDASRDALDREAIEGSSAISHMVRPAIRGRWVDALELRELDDAQSTNHGEQ